MTGKERAALRAQANILEPLFQIGKSGVTQAVAEQFLTACNTRELIKIRVLLDSSPDMPRAAAQKLAEMTGSEIIQVIGGVIVLFKKNEELRRKEAEKKKRLKQAAAAAKKAAKVVRPGRSPLPQSAPKTEKIPLKKAAPKAKPMGKAAAKRGRQETL